MHTSEALKLCADDSAELLGQSNRELVSPVRYLARSEAVKDFLGGGDGNRTRVQGFAGPCLSHSATPPQGRQKHRADDGIRPRDPHLGKVMLYQLSHVRVHLL